MLKEVKVDPIFGGFWKDENPCTVIADPRVDNIVKQRLTLFIKSSCEKLFKQLMLPSPIMRVQKDVFSVDI